MRCVEGWSMVIPWAGFSLSKLLDQVEPLSDAKFVAFETLVDPKRMTNQSAACCPGRMLKACGWTKQCIP